MHWRVLPSPCTIPIPNFDSAPRNASSSLGICPVPRKATDCGPWVSPIFLKRDTIAPTASSHDAGMSLPAALRRSGCVARSGAASGASASHPFGQAVPRLTE